MPGNIKIGGSFPGAAAGGKGTITEVDVQGGPFLTKGSITTSGTITNSTTSLTASAILLGAGTAAVTPLGSLGTTVTVLHGNAAGAPTFGAVSLSADVTGLLPFANLATLAASSLFGNGATVGATGGNIAIGAGVTLSAAGTLTAGGSGGTVTNIVTAAGPFLANTTITAAGTISGSVSTLTNHGILIGQAASAPVATAVMTDGQLLVGATGADPAPQTMSGDATITKAGVLNLGSIVAGGTVGGASLIPIITYDTKGRITATSSAAPIVNGVVTLTGTAAGTLTLTGTTGFQDMDFVINCPAGGGTINLKAAPAASPPRQRFVIDINQGATASVIAPDSTFVFNSSITAYPTDTASTTTRMGGITPDGTKVAVWALVQGSTI